MVTIRTLLLFMKPGVSLKHFVSLIVNNKLMTFNYLKAVKVVFGTKGKERNRKEKI